jgi:type I restriction enzyme S subunit
VIPKGWSLDRVGVWLEEYRENTSQNNQYPVMTSSRGGLVLQSDYYGGSRLTSRDNTGFNVIPPDYLTYRSRSDDGNFYFNKNKLGMHGAISTYYPVFHFPKGCTDFFQYLLNYQRNVFSAFSVGTSQKVLSLNALKEVLLPVPPAHEQKKIAEILSCWDRGIEDVEKLAATVDRRNSALLSILLGGRDDRGQTKSGWKKVALGELAEFVNGKGFKQSEWTTKGYPIIRIQNLNGSNEFNYFDGEIDPKFVIAPETLLFAWSGNRGTSFGPTIWRSQLGVLNQHIFKVLPKEVSRDFLYLLLKFATKVIESEAHGASGLVHVTKSALESFEVCIPQDNSSFEVVSRALMMAFDETNVVQALLKKLREQKQGLMQQLLTGKIRVKVSA